jgi:hypothetical protein
MMQSSFSTEKKTSHMHLAVAKINILWRRPDTEILLRFSTKGGRIKEFSLISPLEEAI